jgi:hypothetical protein
MEQVVVPDNKSEYLLYDLMVLLFCSWSMDEDLSRYLLHLLNSLKERVVVAHNRHLLTAQACTEPNSLDKD